MKFWENFIDGFKIGQQIVKDQKQFIKIIDLKRPMERWEFKYFYIKYKQKIARDRAETTIWDCREKKILTLEEYILEAEKDYISPRNYCLNSTTIVFAGGFHLP